MENYFDLKAKFVIEENYEYDENFFTEMMQIN